MNNNFLIIKNVRFTDYSVKPNILKKLVHAIKIISYTNMSKIKMSYFNLIDVFGCSFFYPLRRLLYCQVLLNKND